MTGNEEMAVPMELGGAGSGSKWLRGSDGPAAMGKRATNAAQQVKAQGGASSLRGSF
jgi:hypothetical protein